jgi:hypothetical protein
MKRITPDLPQPGEIPETHRLTDLEVKLLEKFQGLLATGQVSLVYKLQRKKSAKQIAETVPAWRQRVSDESI